MTIEGIEVALTELLAQTIEATLQRIGGPVMGKVETYDDTSARASVMPLVPLWVDGELVTPPKMHSVPVAWPHGIHVPLPQGALVMLIPFGCDHTQWLTSGSPNVPPDSTRRLSLADLVALPIAPYPTAAAPQAGSYHSTAGVLSGAWKVGSSAAAKKAALHGDSAPAVLQMAEWMIQVETAINILASGSVAPLSPTFASSAIASIVASATKLEAE